MMNFSTFSWLRIIGVALHFAALSSAIAIASYAGTEVLHSRGRFTEAGMLAGLTVGMSSAGGFAFLMYRPKELWKVTLLFIEALVLAASFWWLSIDFVILASATFATALIFVCQKPMRN